MLNPISQNSFLSPFNTEDSTFIHKMVSSGNYRKLKELLQNKDIDVNARDLQGNTPLHIAVELGDLEMVKMLFQNEEIDINAFNPKTDDRPIDVAIKKGNKAMLKTLLKHKDIDLRYSLYEAICNSELEMVKILLAHEKVDVNEGYELEELYSPLCIAVIQKKIEIVKVLLAHDKIDINKTVQFYGTTPLHFAATKSNNLLMLQTLLEDKRVLVNITSPKGSPLHYSLNKNQCLLALALLKHPAIDVNVRDANGNTPLHRLANAKLDGNMLDLYTMLFEKKVNFHTENVEGETFLHILAKKHISINLEYIINFLRIIHISKYTNAKEEIEKIASKYTAFPHFYKTFDLYLTQNQMPNSFAKRKKLNEVTQGIVLPNNTELVSLFNHQDCKGNTPLHVAVLFDNYLAVEDLLKQTEINLNIKNNESQTPLAIAQEANLKNIENLILARLERDNKNE